MIFSDTCFSCENTFSDANAMCCCGAVQNACCPNDCPFPAIMYGRLSINFDTLDSLGVFRFDFNVTNQKWEYTGNLGGLCSQNVLIQFFCQTSPFISWMVQVDGGLLIAGDVICCNEREVLSSFIDLPVVCSDTKVVIAFTDRSDGMIWCCDCRNRFMFQDVTCGLPPTFCLISEFFDLTISGFTDNGPACRCSLWNGTRRLTKSYGCEWNRDDGSGMNTHHFKIYWDPNFNKWYLRLTDAFNALIIYRADTWNCCGTNTFVVDSDPSKICCGTYPATITAVAAGKCADCCIPCASDP